MRRKIQGNATFIDFYPVKNFFTINWYINSRYVHLINKRNNRQQKTQNRLTNFCVKTKSTEQFILNGR